MLVLNDGRLGILAVSFPEFERIIGPAEEAGGCSQAGEVIKQLRTAVEVIQQGMSIRMIAHGSPLTADR